MAYSALNGTETFGSELQSIMYADDIVPGSQASYQTCKTLYLYHPFGQKIVDFPLYMATYKPRKITVPKAPDDGNMLVEAFEQEWKDIKATNHIINAARTSRIYGISTLGVVVKDDDTQEPLDFKKLYGAKIAISTFDPLNTAGSLVLNQDPNALDFQKVTGVSVSGKAYHRSRVCVVMNEAPIYIAYESAGFGFVGRSVYQRGLFPLKSFLMTLATDMMVATKAGLLITKMESQSSAVDRPMLNIFSQKRQMLKEAQTNNVLSIGTTESIESLNLQNLDGAFTMARKNIIENIASACGTPAKMLLSETFAEGFGEGTEDAKAIAQYIDGIREWMQPLYDFMSEIVMYRAWNEDFYKTVQNKYPNEYGDVPYNVAFNEWRNSFHAEWPTLLDEPESEKLRGEDVILKAIISVAEVLMPVVPPEAKAQVLEWMQDNLNSNKRLFASPLNLDFEAIANYEPAVPEKPVSEPRPESLADAGVPKNERFDEVDDDVRRTAMASVNFMRHVG